jgi:hypothetical protein
MKERAAAIKTAEWIFRIAIASSHLLFLACFFWPAFSDVRDLTAGAVFRA